MRLFRLIAIIAALIPGAAFAQSNCPEVASYGNVLTAGQWTNCFQQKQDLLGFVPLNVGGDVMTGKLVTAPSGTAQAGFQLQVGVAPTNPNDGDAWATSSGMFYRSGGATIGPLGAAPPTSVAANQVYSGPTSGGNAAPTFRSLVPADLPVATGSAFGAVKPDGTTITISSGVISAAGASATAIQSGVTGFTSATNGNCAYNNSGTLGNKSCITRVNIVAFQTSGAFTYTPTAGLVYADIKCVGGGGGGGGANGATSATAAGGGGGAGALSEVVSTAATIGASQSGTIGAGGTGTTGGGGTGGDTNVGSLCVAKGGGGGQQGVSSGSNGGLGGVASGGTGTFKIDGNGGAPGIGSAGTSTIAVGGAGAGSFYGGGGRGITLSGGGAAATGCGGGGGGATIVGPASNNGGVGYQGCVIITEYLN